MRSSVYTVFLFALLGTSGFGQESDRDLPPELTQPRFWAPKPGKGSRTRALFQSFDPQSGEVTFLVESSGGGRGQRVGRGGRGGRSNAAQTPTVQTKIRITDLSKNDQQLIRNAFSPPTQADLRPESAGSPKDAKPVPRNRDSETLTSTDYWQAILRYREIVEELCELDYQAELHQQSERIYDKDRATGLQMIQADLVGAQKNLSFFGHSADLKELTLKLVGWDPDPVKRELAIEGYNQRIKQELAVANGRGAGTRGDALSKAFLYPGKNSTKFDYGKTENVWLTMLDLGSERRSIDRRISDMESLAKAQYATTDKETRLRTRNKHEDGRERKKGAMRTLQNEWSDLSVQYSGLPESDIERNRNELVVGLEERCLRKRDDGQMRIEFSAPHWLPLKFRGLFQRSTNDGRFVSYGYPIIAIVAAPAQETGGARRVVLGDVALFPTEEHSTPPAYAKPVNRLPGAMYAYFENGIRVWYGPINLTLEAPHDGFNVFPYGDEMGQLEFLRNTLDLQEMSAALGLDQMAKAQQARQEVQALRTWTDDDGQSTPARLITFDPKTEEVVLDFPKLDDPYTMKLDDLSEQDQKLLLLAFPADK